MTSLVKLDFNSELDQLVFQVQDDSEGVPLVIQAIMPVIVLPIPFRLFGSTKLDGCATVHGGPAHYQVPITIQVSYSNSDNFRVRVESESESATVTGNHQSSSSSES